MAATYAKDATTRVFDKASHLHVGASPCNPVLKDTLLAAWKELFPLFFGQPEFLRQSFNSFTISVLSAVGAESE